MLHPCPQQTLSNISYVMRVLQNAKLAVKRIPPQLFKAALGAVSRSLNADIQFILAFNHHFENIYPGRASYFLGNAQGHTWQIRKRALQIV